MLVWVYNITTNGVTKRVETLRKLNYKKTIAASAAKGNKVWIDFIDCYYYNQGENK